MRVTLQIHVPQPSFQPQVDVARLLERLAWALHAEAEGMGARIFHTSGAVTIDKSTLLIVELKKD